MAEFMDGSCIIVTLWRSPGFRLHSFLWLNLRKISVPNFLDFMDFISAEFEVENEVEKEVSDMSLKLQSFLPVLTAVEFLPLGLLIAFVFLVT